ncbi:hypothetical protein RZR97_02675 [Hydrogenimonas thermophila]|uniref:hypothetical protein n=1 Tax=Hydrogenimonas thermophila TaxID=223786 RepID=UPI002937200F|nr:hypothetical protein [Hydrogenimonas thermophila]WOE70484.1 hypothetical protein RZR91_02690 [Hydrogenimonas thermophila]WOE73001.1 hypothetical protein RZR97_02675 [Hydrogenimonas thermophila]
MFKNLIHGNPYFRGSEVNQSNMSMSIKDRIIVTGILISPSIPIIGVYFILKWIALFFLMAKNKSVDDFVWFDNTFLVIIVASIIAINTYGKKLANEWIEEAIKSNKELISDEYIRGARLICVDEFNKQFNQDDEMIVFEVEDETCNREF